ncbi:glycosyltransferase [Promethearchaeum syntrophicum]|uniref:Glycosyltransferase n=1 Tax=Promethearchaeum syntrophicum TaxID=2594042 RepID=A0A5B9D9S4_9ARCH|nr:glycosyltransferase [Candidatus Prometheoarchaeum syntrophicum]QEE16018.1 undecaprenyl phosphate 4-deoxy-4-formamido-L-arabinose transferase [Candidatus Prometheoarchaeum syntrophicum]
MVESIIEYSVVIPVYNSETSLKELHSRLSKTFESITPNYELIFIDDCSKDNSWKILKELNLDDHKVKIIQLLKNSGQHNAILCGFNFSKGKFIITMDDDLQHPPEEISVLISAIKMDPETDIYVGYPKKKKHGFFRNLASSCANLLNSYFFKKPKELKSGSFRIIRRIIIDEILNSDNSNLVIGPKLLTITNRIKNVSVKHDTRLYGKSNYTFTKYVKMALDNILMNSTLPLRIVSIFGFIISIASFIVGVIKILKYFINGVSVTGWTSIIVAILFLSGMILFSLGLIGEYLIRIIKTVKNNQVYAIREKII